MQTFYARDFGILQGDDVTTEMYALFEKLSEIEGEKTLLFEKGVYHIDRDKCKEIRFAITNTTGKKEYANKDDVNVRHVALYMKNVHDLIVDGQGATFLLDGKMTNLVLESCRNVTIQNAEIDTANPDAHKFTVTKRTPFSAEFELESSSIYEEKDGKYYYTGKGFRREMFKALNLTWRSTTIRPDRPNTIHRTAHPFRGAWRMKELAPYTFRVTYAVPNNLEVGQVFYNFDGMRDEVGIFISESEKITLDNIAQYFNYSLAYVAQNSKDLSVNKLHFAPKKGSDFKFSSIADFMQVCMCSGDVNITNCAFDGAGDDILNVHGFHFKVLESSGNTMKVRFMHPQTYGFNAFRKGEEIAFIDSATLQEQGRCKVVESQLVSDEDILLTLDTNKVPTSPNLHIENLNRSANVYYANNYATRIITRGLLLTTRGKVVVENNHFVSTSMSGILHSNDAKTWYESSRVADVTIKNNRFDYCGGDAILIKPENLRHTESVHSNIRILNNTFGKHEKNTYSIKSSKGIQIKGNTVENGKQTIYMKNVEDLEKDF